MLHTQQSHVCFSVSKYLHAVYMLLLLLLIGEKFHKFNAKMPAATAQLQSQVKFQAQSCQRWYEWHLNQYALSRYGHKSIVQENCTVLNDNMNEDSRKKTPSGYSKDFPLSPLVTLTCKPQPNVTVECITHSKSIGLVQIHPVIMNYVLSPTFGMAPGDIVNIFSEYTDHDDVLYRAHPNYQNGGAWYDWAMVRFEEESLVEGYYDKCLYPTKLLAFVEHIRHTNAAVTKETGAIVHSCDESDHSRDSALTETWISQFDEDNNPVLNLVPLESIDVRLLVIQECPKLSEKKGHSNVVHMVKPKNPC